MSNSKKKPVPEDFGFFSQVGFDGEQGGWMVEGGEDAYRKAMAEYDLEKQATQLLLRSGYKKNGLKEEPDPPPFNGIKIKGLP